MARPSVATDLRRTLELLLTIHQTGPSPVASLAKEFGYASPARLEALLHGFADIDMPDVDPTLFEVFFDDNTAVRVAERHEVFRTPPRLTVTHALVLLTGLNAVAELGDRQLQQAARSLSEKLRAAVVETAGPPALALLDSLELPAPDLDGPRGPLLRTLRTAAGRDRLRLTMWPDGDAEGAGPAELVVDPIRLVADDGRLYLYAWTQGDQRFVAIPFHQVVEARETGSPVDLPKGPLPVFDKSLGAHRPITVRLQLSPQAAWIAEYYQCTVLERHDNGGLIVSMPTPSREWLARLVRRMGGAVGTVGEAA